VDWVPIGSIDDVRRRRRAVVDVGERRIAVFWHEGQVHALDNVCIHRQRELSKGVILNGRVVCPGHQWSFDLRTGHEHTMDRYQPCFPVKIEDGMVFIGTEKKTETCRPSST